MRILAMESSTTSSKAMYYDTETKEMIVETEPYGKMYENEALHNPVMVFEKNMAAGRKALRGKMVDVISLGGTWHSVGLFEKVKPVTPIFQWSYTGASQICKELRKNEGYISAYYQKTGCMINAIYPFFKLMLLRQQGYSLEDYYIMGQGTYNTFRLTGNYVVTRCMASGSGLLDIQKQEYDSDLLKRVGITEKNLPQLISSKEMYPLTEEGAKILGLEEGVPVIPTNADGALNQIGAGALKEGIMTCSIGTSGAIRLSVSKAVLPKTPGFWCYLSPKTYLSGAAISGCCNCVDWFRNKIAEGASYEELETEKGAELDTPVFLPFLFGERCPGWRDERSGGFFELKAQHDRRAMYRAVQEGILFNLYHCYQLLTRVNEQPKRIKVSGGIASSKVWLQMCADIFSREIEVSRVQQESLMGAVVWAMERMGITDAEAFTTETAQIILPNKNNIKQYQEKFDRYLKCYYLEKN